MLKLLTKTQLSQACYIVEEIYSSAVIKKSNGKKVICPGMVKKTSKLEELMNLIEVLQDKNLKDVPLNLRKYREYQFKLTCSGKSIWRICILCGMNTIHDLSRVIMVCFNWMPAQRAAIFKWRSNQGSPFGFFKSTKKELKNIINNRINFKKLSIAEVFIKFQEVLEWFYGDQRIQIKCMGVTPGKDLINRALPRCVGGIGLGPPHINALCTNWRPQWNIQTILGINETFLGDRFIRDIFKKSTEFQLDSNSALRRQCPFFDDKKQLLKPFTENIFTFGPMLHEQLTEAWKYKFRCVRKAEVRNGFDPAADFICGLDVDTRVIVNIVKANRAHIILPINGWVWTRDPRGKRILQEIKYVRDNAESFLF